MSAEYVTLDIYKKKLKAGGYDNVTAAKRALGRVQKMSKADKDVARKAAERHFGVKPKSLRSAKKSPRAAKKG